MARAILCAVVVLGVASCTSPKAEAPAATEADTSVSTVTSTERADADPAPDQPTPVVASSHKTKR